MNRLLALTLSPVAALLLAALPAAAHDDPENRVRTRLKSYEEVPSVSSVASGRFHAQIDDNAGSIAYELSFDGLEGDVRQAHNHVGPRSANGGISVFLCQTSFNPDPTGLAPVCPQSGTVTGVLTAANVIGPAGQGVAAQEFAELVQAIRAGVAYANVHSTKFPGGEVRGQLK